MGINNGGKRIAFEKNKPVVYIPYSYSAAVLLIPGILIVDLRAKMTKCCFKMSCKGLAGGNAGAANQSVYVTTAAASAASRVTSHSNLLALTPNAPSQTW